MGFSRQENWSGLPFPPPGVFPTGDWTHISCVSCIAGRKFFTTWAIWKAHKNGKNSQPVVNTYCVLPARLQAGCPRQSTQGLNLRLISPVLIGGSFISVTTWVWSDCNSKRSSAKLTWRISSVQFSCSVMSDSLQPRGLQHARLPCPSSTPTAYSNSCPLSRWCHPTISRMTFSIVVTGMSLLGEGIL